MANKIRKGLVGLLGSAMIAFGMSGKVKADGALGVQYIVGSQTNIGELDLMDYNDLSISDGIDSWDSLFPEGKSGSGVYSNLNKINKGNYHLIEDFRQNGSTAPFIIDDIFTGTLSSITNQYMTFSFLNAPAMEFEDHQYLTLQQLDSSGNPIGRGYDLRSIGNGTGIFELPPLSAGSYDNTVVATYQIDFSIPTPEPSTISLLAAAGIGALGVGYLARRKNGKYEISEKE